MVSTVSIPCSPALEASCSLSNAWPQNNTWNPETALWCSRVSTNIYAPNGFKAWYKYDEKNINHEFPLSSEIAFWWETYSWSLGLMVKNVQLEMLNKSDSIGLWGPVITEAFLGVHGSLPLATPALLCWIRGGRLKPPCSMLREVWGGTAAAYPRRRHSSSAGWLPHGARRCSRHSSVCAMGCGSARVETQPLSARNPHMCCCCWATCLRMYTLSSEAHSPQKLKLFIMLTVWLVIFQKREINIWSYIQSIRKML